MVSFVHWMLAQSLYLTSHLDRIPKLSQGILGVCNLETVEEKNKQAKLPMIREHHPHDPDHKRDGRSREPFDMWILGADRQYVCGDAKWTSTGALTEE